MTNIRSQSCTSCPYRRDVPSGVWAAHEYDKLVEYDLPTSAQPWGAFHCHATPETYCHGWAVCHSTRGHRFELLALRMAQINGHFDGVLPEPDPGLFSSGAEAAEHGKREIEQPSEAARDTVERLTRKYPRLRTYTESDVFIVMEQIDKGVAERIVDADDDADYGEIEFEVLKQIFDDAPNKEAVLEAAERYGYTAAAFTSRQGWREYIDALPKTRLTD